MAVTRTTRQKAAHVASPGPVKGSRAAAKIQQHPSPGPMKDSRAQQKLQKINLKSPHEVQQRHLKTAPQVQSSLRKAPPTPRKKRTININDIFDQPKRVRVQVQDPLSCLSPRPAGITKNRGAKPGFFKAPAREDSFPKRQAAKPGFFAKWHTKAKNGEGFGFAEPMGDYAQAASASFEQRMANWQKELQARRNGLDKNGEPLSGPPIPTEDDIEALTKQLEDLNKPLEEEVLHIQNGETTKRIKLGDSMQLLHQRLERRNAHIARLEKDHGRVSAEIDILKEEIFGQGEDYKKAVAEYEAQVALLQKEVDKVEAKYKEEMREMKKGQREAVKEFNRRVQDLWNGIPDDD